MGSQLNPLSRVLTDSKPRVWLPPSDFVPQQRKTHAVAGVAAFLDELKASNEHRPVVTKTRLQRQIEEMKSREMQRLAELERQRLQWDPKRDESIQGDPYNTLIVARLRYTVTEGELRSEFGQYGRIEHIRVIPYRGYAFVVFDNAQAARSALQNTANGVTIQGHRAITDLEKGRTQKGWLPRRLGGGLGGRFSLARQKADLQRAQQIQRMFRAQKRDSRGNSRPNDGSVKIDGRRDMRRPPLTFDPRRGPVPRPYSNEGNELPPPEMARPSAQTARHEPTYRALRRY